ncbi:MAG: type II secretion system F family protein [Acidimicrobiia bacterium]
MRRRFGLSAVGSLAAAGVFVAAALAGVGPAAGADGNAATAPLIVRSADSRSYADDQMVKLTVLAKGDAPASADYQVEVDKKAAANLQAQSLADANVPVGIVFVVDSSRLMDTDGAIDQVRTALNGVVNRRTTNERFAIVAAGVNPRLVSEFTSDPTSFKAALDTVRPTTRSDSSLVDSVQMAMNLFRKDTTGMQRNIVIATASSDDASTTQLDPVLYGLVDTATLVFGTSLDTNGFNTAVLSQITNRSGGGYVQAKTTSEFAANVSDMVSLLRGQQQLTFTGAEKAITADITVTAKNFKGHAYIATGTFVEGANVDPPIHSPALSKGPGFFRSNAGKFFAAIAALMACFLAALAIGLVVFRDRTTLDDVLQVYSEDPRRRLVAEEPDDEEKNSIAKTQFMKRAVAFTGDLAQRRGILVWVEQALEQADLPLRAAEALLVYALGSVLLVAMMAVLTHKLLLSLILLLLVLLAPPSALNFLASKRKRKFTSQLPDTLSLISGSLKAGYSLMQGLEAVSQEVPDPMGRELRRIVVETQLGRPVEEALEESAARMGSPDFAWAVMAIRIQREVGGNLAELLTTVGETMVARERLHRDVRSLTAEGRMSAIVIGVLPIVLGFAMWTINKSYINTLFQERVGNFLLGFAVLLMLFGFWWMKKTIEIEV